MTSARWATWCRQDPREKPLVKGLIQWREIRPAGITSAHTGTFGSILPTACSRRNLISEPYLWHWRRPRTCQREGTRSETSRREGCAPKQESCTREDRTVTWNGSTHDLKYVTHWRSGSLHVHPHTEIADLIAARWTKPKEAFLPSP